MAIGTTAAIIGAGALSAGVGALGASKAASAQKSAANSANALQQYIFEQSREDQQPFRETGVDALNALNFEVMGGPRPVFDRSVTEKDGAFRIARDGGGLNPTKYGSFNAAQADAERQGNRLGTTYRGFQATPGYQFRVSEGQKGIERSAAARGGLLSGATMKATERFRQGIAAEEYGNHLNRLAALSGGGQTATNALSALGQNYANSSAQTALAGGQARASGYLGMAQQGQNFVGNTLSGLAYGRYLQ